jgi:hypothetical protein
MATKKQTKENMCIASQVGCLLLSYTTKGCCVEKFGLRERKLSAVFSILLIFGGLFKAWWTVRNTKLNILCVYNTKINIIFNNS